MARPLIQELFIANWGYWLTIPYRAGVRPNVDRWRSQSPRMSPGAKARSSTGAKNESGAENLKFSIDSCGAASYCCLILTEIVYL